MKRIEPLTADDRIRLEKSSKDLKDAKSGVPIFLALILGASYFSQLFLIFLPMPILLWFVLRYIEKKQVESHLQTTKVVAETRIEDKIKRW